MHFFLDFSAKKKISNFHRNSESFEKGKADIHGLVCTNKTPSDTQ